MKINGDKCSLNDERLKAEIRKLVDSLVLPVAYQSVIRSGRHRNLGEFNRSSAFSSVIDLFNGEVVGRAMADHHRRRVGVSTTRL